ncbi:hypothetical protein [Cellulophaga baltica]|uniref:Fibronectin type-III domain-containing protein n=1 Tax=Cellulophaga baltica 18 TaxID=1348584 RepID=A0AAU8RHP5_9FLAO|nr:hypothetical protein [Cellulophaga baltica]AIZ42897.1 hypothetical protein M666_15770 [Cellulophaga baltica 18]
MKKYLLTLIIVLVFGCKKSDDASPIVEPETLNTAPTVPVKTYPTNGLLCTENPLEFKWNSATDKEGDVISYELEIASDAGFNNIIERVTINSTSKILVLEKGIELNWRLRSKDTQNEVSPYSPNWKFYTEGDGVINYVPFTPSLIAPILDTKVSGSMAKLEWSSSDVDNDSLSYDIYFGETTPPALFDENITNTSYEININPNQTNYWKIIVKDGKGGEAIGAIWKFKS